MMKGTCPRRPRGIICNAQLESEHQRFPDPNHIVVVGTLHNDEVDIQIGQGIRYDEWLQVCVQGASDRRCGTALVFQIGVEDRRVSWT